MPRGWTTTPLPLLGSPGEQTDAAAGNLDPGALRLLRNGLIAGKGMIGQSPDWLVGDACLRPGAPPNYQVHAVCGIFPFAQQGGASAPSAGVAISYNNDADRLYLHQLGETLTVLRTFTIGTAVALAYTGATPPQITGFEMFGKFYFAIYDALGAGALGMYVFDPTGGGTVVAPTFVLGAGPAGALFFRGISKHRGATILGWGFLSETTPFDPDVLRYSKYGAPDTWVPDTTDQTAGAINVGTLKIPIVACAMSDQYTIIGKETEVFALDGDFSSQFYYRRIGVAHGPIATTGMVEIPDAAVWLSLAGPAMSVRGEKVQLIAIDRVTKRFLTFVDLATVCGVHDPARHRVVWGVRRAVDDDGLPIAAVPNGVSVFPLVGDPVTPPFLDELFWWDYERQAFGVQTPPRVFFCLGTVRGPGVAPPGSSGTVSGITATEIDDVSARISWTPGDTSPNVSFHLQFRKNSAVSWQEGGTALPGNLSIVLTSLAVVTLYDVRVSQVKNGLESAFTVATALFTTLAVPTTPNPVGPAVALNGVIFGSGGITSRGVHGTWAAFGAGTTKQVGLYRSTTASPFPGAAGLVAKAAASAGVVDDPTAHAEGTTWYYWLRTEAVDVHGAVVVGTEVTAAPFPFTITAP